MKVSKIITLLISILFPLIVTAFIAFYAYGSVGGWSKNKDRFTEHYFNSKYTTEEQIERAVKFSSSRYQKNISNISFRDPETKDAHSLDNGTLKLTNSFSMKSYAILNEFESTAAIQYVFFIYDIAYGTKDEPIVKPTDLYIVSVQGVGEKADSYLNSALDSLEDSIKADNTTGAATPSTSQTGYRPIYDNNADDPQNADKAHYAYSITPNNTFSFTHYEDTGSTNIGTDVASMPFLQTRETTFALVQKTGNLSEPIKVWTEGTLSNIKSSTTSNNELNFNTLTGLNTGLKSDYEAAGYLKFVWPTILWQSAIALVITSALSYLFYNIWTLEEQETVRLKQKTSKKVKK